MEKKYFYGNEISEYGIENGFVDYKALAKSFDAVLNNNIIHTDFESWDIVNGDLFSYEKEDGTYITEGEYCELSEEEQEKCYEHYEDVFQYYIVSDNGARILMEETDELVWYNGNLDMYVWGITHYGTGWDYVLTDIKITW